MSNKLTDRNANSGGKKKWEKPMLIVLTRGDGQENVLAGCKFPNITGSPFTLDMACIKSISYYGSCVPCASMTAS